MNKLLIALCFAVGFASSAYAKEEKAQTAQQSKMATCNKDAGEKALKGNERKKFMSDCLKAKPATEEAKPAAEAMKPTTAMGACNKAAEGKKGDERNKFMSDCLKAKGPDNMKK